MVNYVRLEHGNGGKLAHELINKVFVPEFGMAEALTDSALITMQGNRLAYTTDSYVVDPLFFPGGDIGKLAICGTVNDLAVSGAEPRFISASFIIEEGFPLSDLIRVAESMSREAFDAGVRIVTGDTKVVEKGKCDKLFITTSGIGILPDGREHISTGKYIRPGDFILVNGTMGNHAVAVLGARNELDFTTPVKSDVTSLNHLIKSVLDASDGVFFMRDITRGGLATVLNELAGLINMGVIINEDSVPVDEPVRGVCEMLGFDPLYMANEGKILLVVHAGKENAILELLRSFPKGKNAMIIGETVSDSRSMVILKTKGGGKRILDMPSGLQLPRIC